MYVHVAHQILTLALFFIEKEKKKAQKEMKKAEEKVKSTVLQVIEQVMSAAEKEPLPTTPEAKEKYFMEQVAAGESLCNRGKFVRWSR